MSGSQFGELARKTLIPQLCAAFALALLLAAPGLARAQSPDAAPAPSTNPGDNSASPAASPAPADDNPLHTASRLELDVVKVVLAQEKAWNAGDLDAYIKAYKDSPDTIFIGKQISKGYAQILDDYKHNYLTRTSMGTLTFSELEVHPLSDTFAVCLGKYHLDRGKKDGGPADGMFSLVMEKTSDGWKIVLDHTT